jgi:hypothetical protein
MKTAIKKRRFASASLTRRSEVSLCHAGQAYRHQPAGHKLPCHEITALNNGFFSGKRAHGS